MQLQLMGWLRAVQLTQVSFSGSRRCKEVRQACDTFDLLKMLRRSTAR
jgi:hypothetical protein